MSPKPIEFEIKKSLLELLMISWARTAEGGMVGAIHCGADGGGPVSNPRNVEGALSEWYSPMSSSNHG